IIDSLLLICFMGGVRLARRFYHGMTMINPQKRLLIYGAGDTGEIIVRDIRNNRDEYDYEPIGFIDDDRQKVGRRIHGVPVLGITDELHKIMVREKPHEVLLAVPRAQPAAIRKLVNALAPFKVPIRTLPSVRNGDNGGARSINIPDLSIANPPGSPPIYLHSKTLRPFVISTPDRRATE